MANGSCAEEQEIPAVLVDGEPRGYIDACTESIHEDVAELSSFIRGFGSSAVRAAQPRVPSIDGEGVEGDTLIALW